MKQILIIIFLALLPALSFAQNATSPDKAKTIAAELEKKDKLQKTNNSNNNTRSNKGRCCKNEIAPQAGATYITFNAATKWYNWKETNNTEVACPNPITMLRDIKIEWVADLYTGSGDFVSTKNVQISNNEMIMSVNGLSNGLYYIEIKNGTNYYRTLFRVGSDLNAIKEVKPQVKKKGN
ncbi:MAG: hypothetical protein KA270_00820 [Saprospiraceae bacterium]|nr:hypothetical protein [Saprospiraceae bacterium]MBP6565671.1 hypothetical protein [Saprospiraceae bacterium]